MIILFLKVTSLVNHNRKTPQKHDLFMNQRLAGNNGEDSITATSHLKFPTPGRLLFQILPTE
jgi:hypothetical protein